MSERDMSKTVYGNNFYKDRHQRTLYAAETILSIVIDALPAVHSAIDFGCGVGTWLSVLKEKGVHDIHGIDGPWVKQDLLEIPVHNFQEVNFEEGIKLNIKYDLAISLEVVEHLSPQLAVTFVESLSAASDFILFSAAIPYQGGKGHINEQWPDYWVKLFNEKGFVALDFIRKRIWNDKHIATWYRQNILMFVKKDQKHRVSLPWLKECDKSLPTSLVHPDLYLRKARQMSSVKGSWKLFRRALKNWMKAKTGRKESL